jgi:hypothetical protein
MHSTAAGKAYLSRLLNLTGTLNISIHTLDLLVYRGVVIADVKRSEELNDGGIFGSCLKPEHGSLIFTGPLVTFPW